MKTPGWSRQLGQTRHDKIKHEDPQLASKKTWVSAWSSALDPTRLKDVRGLAADGSSETQGLLKMIFFLVCCGRALFLLQRKRPPSLT